MSSYLKSLLFQKTISAKYSMCKEIIFKHKYINGSLFILVSGLIYIIYKGKLVAIKDFIGRRFMYDPIPDIAEANKKSVVYIEVLNENEIDERTGEPVRLLRGSGFVVKNDGLIVTCSHVIFNQLPFPKILVKFMDKTTYTAYIEDIEFKADVATLRIDAKKLPTMKLGTSAKVRQGQAVVSIGNNLTFKSSVTTGVVSCENRRGDEVGLVENEHLLFWGPDMEYIQTDALISCGNSGGPMLNLSGEVIGVSAILLSGLPLAVPIDYIKDFLKKCASNSTRYLHKTLGFSMLLLTKKSRKVLGTNRCIPKHIESSVVVYRVLFESPAWVGGLKCSDVIISVDGNKVVTSKDVYSALDKAGDKMEFVVWRGHTLHLTITPNFN